MPPTPKPPGQRRRRNAGQSQWKTLPATGRSGAAPKLPTKKPAWLKQTRDWWATIWRSPMATVWADADVEGLVRLARLKDEFVRGSLPASSLGQITILEDRYGLNPKSRRALQWEISKAEESEPTHAAKVRHLRAVG